jgi:hypothetical protein
MLMLCFKPPVHDACVCVYVLLGKNLTDRQTALHYAATVELPDMCCLLLESGADPNLEDEDGETPASLGALEMAKQYSNDAQ